MCAIVGVTAGIYGDHLILLNSEGLLAALFVYGTVESWNELKSSLSFSRDSFAHLPVRGGRMYTLEGLFGRRRPATNDDRMTLRKEAIEGACHHKKRGA